MRKTTIALIAALQTLTVGLTAYANTPAVRVAQAGETTPTLNIPAQALAESLKALGAQTNTNIIVSPDLVDGRTAPALKASLTVDQAMAQLLKGTGLTYQFINDRTVAVTARKPAASSVTRLPSPETGEGAGVRVSQAMRRVEPPSLGTGEGRGDVNELSGESEKSSESGDSGAGGSTKGIPELLVKGKRSLNTDIKRTEDDPQPYVVFDREQIERSQATNLEEFLRTRLPMNTANMSNSQAAASPSARNTSSINLRGLGEDETLILVDGRRMPGVANLGQPYQPDINGIPMSAVERIEVLPSTAGGIYGGSATGGVINIILRRDYQGVDAKATYANTFDTDTGSVRLDATAGFSLGVRTQVMISASRSEGNSLLLGDRAELAKRSFGLVMRNNPGLVTDSPYPVLGGTVNIRSAEGELTLDPEYGGTPLGEMMTHVPLGYAGPDSDDGEALIRNAGSYNTELPAGVSGRGQGLIVTPAMESASMNVRHQFTDWLEGFVDVSQLGNKGKSSFANVPNWASLAADAPNNPFQQAINVAFPTPGLSVDVHSDSTTVRTMGGLIARLPRRWTAEVDYNWSRSRLYNEAGDAIGYGAWDAINTGLPTPEGRPALNVLQEGNTYPLDFTPYMLPQPNFFYGPYRTVLKNTTVRLSGPAFTLPGGPINFSFLLERRREEMKDARSREADVWSPTAEVFHYFMPHKSQGADSYYLEARAPLISASNARGWAQELELQASVRRDEYETRSTGEFLISVPSPDSPIPEFDYTRSGTESNNYTLGARYVPIEGLAVRASFGTGFLPPSVTQIVPSLQPVGFAFGLDPKRGNTSMYVGLPYTWIFGGNSSLRPETSESWSAGLILTPRFAPGLRLSVDYTRIDKVNEIQTPLPDYILQHEDELPGRVVRGEELPGDPPEWAGRIVSIDTSMINAAKTAVKAYDIQFDYTRQTRGGGTLNWYALATWQPDYKNQPFETDPIINQVGFSDGVVEWRGNAGFDWTVGQWSLGWNMQYYGSHLVYASFSDDSTIDLYTDTQGTDTIPSQMYHDLIGTYRFDGASRFGGRLLVNSQLTVGIQNIFNTYPESIFSSQLIRYSPHGDVRLRRYSIAFRKNF